MVMFAPPRTVRPAHRGDLPRLQAVLPQGPPDKHEVRLARQERGEAIYLVAVQEDEPVGHALLVWQGNLLTAVPQIDDLYVHEDHRGRHVASRLLDAAEQAAATRGFARIGLSCGTENHRAQSLYRRRGYTDAGLGAFRDSGRYLDAQGQEQIWDEECIYLLLSLEGVTQPAPGVSEIQERPTSRGESQTMSEQATAQQNDPSPEQTVGTENAAPDAGVQESGAPDNGNKGAAPQGRTLADRVLDFAFGVGVLTAEAVDAVVNTAAEKAKQIQGDAPSLVVALEDRGRPAREKFVRDLREGTLSVSGPAISTDGGEAKRRAAAGVVAGAEDEIRILEERVRVLERELSAPPQTEDSAPAVADVVVEPAADIAPAPSVEASASSVEETTEPQVTAEAEPPPTAYVAPTWSTTAEQATFVNDFTPETPTPTSLADSPYAISETEDEVAAEKAQAAHEAEAELRIQAQAAEEEQASERGEIAITSPRQRGGRRKATNEASSEENPGDSSETADNTAENGAA